MGDKSWVEEEACAKVLSKKKASIDGEGGG